MKSFNMTWIHLLAMNAQPPKNRSHSTLQNPSYTQLIDSWEPNNFERQFNNNNKAINNLD